MASALTPSEKSLSLPEELRKKSSLTQLNSTTIPKQEQHRAKNIRPTTHQEQFDKIDLDDDSFDDEDEEETQWPFEQRTATLRDTKKSTQEFLAACTRLKENVSTKVDDLLNDLPDVHNPQFETKYKIVPRRLQKLLLKNWNKSKQQIKKKQ